MPEQLLKLSPDQDLSCFYLTPTAIAAMSGASASGYTLSGTWRQQFDWAVVEWDRDNVYEHPSIRYLPDGDLSGLHLSYEETRTGCIPFESNLYPTVDWPYLRLWATAADGVEHVYFVPIAGLATPTTQSYQSASGTMTLQGTAQVGDHVGLCMPVPSPSGLPEQHYYYAVQTGDTLETIASNLSININSLSPDFTAAASGASLTVKCKGYPKTNNPLTTGANGNRLTIYGYTSGAGINAAPTESWVSPTVTLSGGAFPSTYGVSLDFGNLLGYQDVPSASLVPVPTTNVRKMRWTWAADLQPASFQRMEFQVAVANWQVTGNNRQLYVAGPGSRRLEDSGNAVAYKGSWANAQGNYSGNWIHWTQAQGDTATFTYTQSESHSLYLGTQTVGNGATVSVTVNGSNTQTFNLNTPGEQVLVRKLLGVFPAGSYTVIATHAGAGPSVVATPVPPYTLYVDFLEIAFPTADLPSASENPQLALATDWDTYQSQSLPAERTAWMIQQLNFTGRVNHYAGALWFYELIMPGHVYDSAQVTFSMSGAGAGTTEIQIGPAGAQSSIVHYNLPDDNASTVAQAFVCLINNGYTSIWASAYENVLTITARAMTASPYNTDAPPTISLAVTTTSGSNVTAIASSGTLSGGVAGTPYDDDNTEQSLGPFTQYWRTDVNVVPRINRAARDWHQAYFAALRLYGIEVVTSFSTELLNADPGVDANLAQRQSNGSPLLVATPAVQTNFSPNSLSYWKQVYLDMAGLQAAAGIVPYLQFGEMQWWYFQGSQPTGAVDSQGSAVPAVVVSMPYYDSYTTSQFQSVYGSAIPVISNQNVDPSQYQNAVNLLQGLLGQHAEAIRVAVRAQYPNCRLEVLYPVDTNASAWDSLVNYAPSEWTPENYNCLKTESFTYTYGRNLNESMEAIETSAQKGFPNASRSHLIGISDSAAPWVREVDLARSAGLESVVLFALDQFCLIGYPPPVLRQVNSRRLA